MIFFFLIQPNTFGFVLITNGGKAAHWPGGQIAYQFHTGSSGYFEDSMDFSGTPTDEFEAIEDSFRAWENIPGLILSFTRGLNTERQASSTDGKNTIAWVRSNWRSLSFRPPSNALAVTLLSFDYDTGAIVDADIYFNSETFRWAVVDSAEEIDYVDVQNIATHEIGHLMGLDHSSEKYFETEPELADATMYYASSSGEISRRDPHQDDINGVMALYSADAVAVPTIDSAQKVESSTGSITFRITGSNFGDTTTFLLTTYDDRCPDAVSRYRTIASETEATAEFEVSSCLVGSAKLLAFNSLSEAAVLGTTVEGVGYEATSNSGNAGGGCRLSAESGKSSLWSIVFIVLSMFSLFIIRKKLLF